MVFRDFVELLIYCLNFDLFWRGLQLTLDLGYRSIIMQFKSHTFLDLIADHINQNDFHDEARTLDTTQTPTWIII